MKHFLTFLMLTLSYLLCGAQATSLTVDNQTPGWLSSKIGYGDQQTVENLTISGYLNPDDLKFIGTLINNQSLKGHINLEDCQIIDKYGNLTNALEENSFKISYSVKNPKISRITMPISLCSTHNCIGGYVTIDTLVVGGTALTKIEEHDFSYARGSNGNIRHLILREGVEEIGRHSFYQSNSYSMDYDEAVASDVIQREMPKLESVHFPETMKNIGVEAFDWCINLKTFNLPNSLEIIDNKAFEMTGFRPDTLYLPESLTQYNTTAFTIKDGQTVIIPESVNRIDNTYETYYNMTNTWTTHDYLNSSNRYYWVMKSVTPPSVHYRGELFLKGSTIYVPRNSVSIYSNTKPYSSANIIEQTVKATDIRIVPTELRIAIGESITLNAVIYPADASSKSVAWFSTNPSVATVSQSGVVTAVSEGEATILASTMDGSNLSATCQVSVYRNAVLVSDIILGTTLLEGYENETIVISAVVIPQDADNKQLIWRSSNENVATVADGVIKLLKKGTAIISAEATDGSNVRSQCVVVVSETSGIDSIIEDKTTYVKIFNLNGHLIYEGTYEDAKVDEGIYIVTCNGKSYKTKIE